jgi:hypothetical protein
MKFEIKISGIVPSSRDFMKTLKMKLLQKFDESNPLRLDSNFKQ